MDKLKGIAIAGAAGLVIVGGIIYSQLDTLFPDEPRGPGSDDFYAHEEQDEPQGPGSDDFYAGLENEPTGPGSGDELNEETFAKYAIASCNTIDDGSTCVEYIGSYWSTPDVAALNCQGVGVYVEKACPRPTSGGCRMNGDTSWEMIAWFYPYGGDPITSDIIPYASGSCNATGAQYIFNN